MRRSKLEVYVDILSVLAQRGPLKLTHIMYKAHVNCSVLVEYLGFLMQKELAVERSGFCPACRRVRSKYESQIALKD